MSNKQSDKLIFHDSPVVEFGGNAFQNVPVILQYEDKPLIEVVRVAQAGYEIQLSIYDKSGLYITKVKSSQAYRTEEAKRAGVALEHAVDATTCKWNGHTICDLKRSGQAAWRGWGEVYNAAGVFEKGTDTKSGSCNVCGS